MKSVNHDQIQKWHNSIGITHLGTVTFTVIVMESTVSLLPLGMYLLPLTIINIYLPVEDPGFSRGGCANSQIGII